MQAYIAMGSNLGDGEANIRQALAALEKQGVHIVKTSTLIRTAPYGVLDQPDFINGVCEVATDLSPLELLHTMLQLELDMGRVRKRHWGERNIDLDLLLYEDEVLDLPDLKLPHPDMQNRSFVLEPLAEIAPEVIHPIFHKTIRELLGELSCKN